MIEMDGTVILKFRTIKKRDHSGFGMSIMLEHFALHIKNLFTSLCIQQSSLGLECLIQ
jgi:hypothetical protein